MPEQHLAQLDKYFYSPPRKEFSAREIRCILQRHGLLLITIVGIITTAATIVMLLAKPIYLASCILEIRKDSSHLVKSGDTLLSEEDNAATIINIKTDIVMMKSHELIEDVVVNLHLDRNPKFLDGLDRWSLRRSFNRNLNAPPQTLIRYDAIRKSDDDLGRPADESARLDPFVRLIETNLNIEQIKETRALKVSFTHTDPLIAAAVADGVARNFIQRNFQRQTERLSNTIAWLDQSTLELKERVEKAEQKLANYTRANNIFTTEGKSTLTTDKLSKLHDQVTHAEANRMLKETLVEEVRRGRVEAVPEVFAEMTSKSSPRITELQKQLSHLTATEAQLGVHFGPSNPQLQEVRRQIATIREQVEDGRRSLNDKLRTEYEHAVLDEESLKEALARAKAEAVNENQAAIQYNVLKQEVDTAKALYTEFLQKSNQSKIQAAEQHSNIRIIDHAKVPLRASGPRRALTILLWFTISLVVGIGSVLLLEFFNDSLKDGEDIELSKSEAGRLVHGSD
jgi:uncharacterized protein involved in exopolysaccharide biosynthesis